MPTLPRTLRLRAAPLASLLAAALPLLATPAAAQSPPDAGRLLEQTQPPPRPVLPPAQAPRVVEPPVRPTINMPAGVTVTPSAFRITGASSFPVETLTALVQPYVGRKLDLAGLNEAAGTITRHYQAAGHLLTYAYLPAQRVADGVIELAVLEGRIEATQIVTAQEVRLRDEVVQAHVEALAGQVPLRQADVERKLLLLNDIPGVTARGAFTPGATTGGADIIVSVAEEEPLDLKLELNNHGSRSIGEYRAGLSLQLRDLFGWGDQTTARALTSSKGGLVSGTLAMSVPVGGDGYRLGASLSRLTYQLGGDFRSLGAAGNANTFGIDASYPLVRSTDRNLWIKAAYEQKRLRDDILVTGSSNPKRNDVFDLTLSFDARDRFGGTAGSLTGSMGDLKLQNDARRADDTLGIAREYRKATMQLVRQQALSGPWSLYLRLAGQASGGNLDSSEKLGLAGPGMVRAYAPGAASVDQGAYLGAELRYVRDYVGGSFVWALFHEDAQGLINRRPPASLLAGNEVKLGGSGLSVQWSGGDVGLSASLAWRSRRALGAEGSDTQPRLYLQMVVTP
ncbi:MAG: ShlB/FhaC/HecB family hemolysin secretion/activation protein [Rubrivivax sp.]|nr:ShlB/FhaC/HecB family hemolysin secretion/activation protein [Rubrivivax sp.]